MDRIGIINGLIAERGYASYLEIGVDRRQCFDAVRCARKTCVDPNVPADFHMTSDEFFRTATGSYDLIFIDGLHEAGQVVRDIENALAHLEPGGTIVVHDCNPPREEHATDEPWSNTEPWCGTVWKGWARLRMERPDLSMRVVDCDLGVGIVEPGTQECYPRCDIEWALMETDRERLLNLVPA